MIVRRSTEDLWVVRPRPDGIMGVKFKVENGGSQDLEEFQVKLELPYSSQGEKYVVFDENGNEVFYWFEDNQTVWVKLKRIPAGQSVDVWMVMDENSNLEDPEKVFEFFDDFEGTELDTSKWTEFDSGGSYTVANSEIELNPVDNQTNAVAIRSNFTFTNDIIIEEKLRTNTDTYWDIALSTTSSVSTTSWHWFEPTSHRGYNIITQNINNSDGGLGLFKRNDTDKYNLCYTANGCGYYSGSYSVGSDTLVRFVVKSDGTLRGEWYYYGGSQIAWVETTDTEYISSPKYLVLWQGEYSNGWGGESWIDWVRVRKYADPEPTATAVAKIVHVS